MATGRYPIPYGETVEQWSDEASGKGATHKRERNHPRGRVYTRRARTALARSNERQGALGGKPLLGGGWRIQPARTGSAAGRSKSRGRPPTTAGPTSFSG